MKKSSLEDKRRKLRLISKIFTGLYEEGVVSSNNPRKITKDDIIAYVGFRRSKGISESTIGKDICLLNQFFLWLDNHSVEQFRMFGGIFKPHSYTGRKTPMSNDVIDRVIELARSTDNWNILRGCTQILLCCCCGLRTQEARMMYVDGIVRMGGKMIVHVEHVKGEGSWGEPRNVLVMDGIEDIIDKYLFERKRILEEYDRVSRSLFVPIHSQSEFYVSQSFTKLKAPVEEVLGEKIDLRSGRRAYGQRLLDKGNRLDDVSVAMGHASTKTTEGYYARVREDDVFARLLANEESR